MNRKTVLVLGSYKNTELTDILYDAGCEPVVRRKMMEALERIRHRSFAAIVVDRDVTDVDLLEFTFNVRDYKPEIPIVIVGKRLRTATDPMVQSLPGITDLGEVADRQELPAKLKETVFQYSQ